MQLFATPTRRVFLLAFATWGVIGVGSAWAQISGGAGGGGGGAAALPGVGDPQNRSLPTIAAPPTAKTSKATPDALPGAAARSDRVAPSQGVVIANPTDALFDSVNRGDIATARDAIDRGADLDGRNVLGMTPLDLSVDLGRNDITFLLLSLRAGDSRPRSGPGAQTAKAGHVVKAGQTAKAQTAKTGKSAPGHGPAPSHASVAVRAPTTSPATPAAPQLFAGDGGTPNPGVGFLGFDNRH